MLFVLVEGLTETSSSVVDVGEESGVVRVQRVEVAGELGKEGNLSLLAGDRW